MLTKWIDITDKDPKFTIKYIKQLLNENKVVYATKYSFGSERILAAIQHDNLNWLAVTGKNFRMILEWYDCISYRDWIWK